MPRLILAVLACLLLEACSGWVSDERLFGEGDWAHLDINGRYTNALGESNEQLIFKTLPSGLIESRNPTKPKEQRSLLGLVPIEDGSSEYFLSVDRSDDSADGDQYFIAHVSEDKTLTFYLPDCEATPPIEGMIKVRDDRGGVRSEDASVDDTSPGQPAAVPDKADKDTDDDTNKQLCKFATKDALMKAGLEAEKFLSAKHIVTIFGITYQPVEEANKPVKKRPTRRPPPPPSHP